MNRIRSRLSIMGVLLLALTVLYGCTYDVCWSICVIPCTPLILVPPMFWTCGTECSHFCGTHFQSLQNCSERPDECAATWEQLQLTAIEFCEEYPDECQQYFDAWVESLNEEDRK